jgi:hypothetical protein
MKSTTEFLLRRASEESLKAISSHLPEAADAHEELAVRYSSEAVAALADGDEPTSGSGAECTEQQAPPG